MIRLVVNHANLLIVYFNMGETRLEENLFPLHPHLFFSYLCRCGDEIIEINEASVQNTTLNEVYAVLSHCDPGAVQIIISRHPEPQVAHSVFFLTCNKGHEEN